MSKQLLLGDEAIATSSMATELVMGKTIEEIGRAHV